MRRIALGVGVVLLTLLGAVRAEAASCVASPTGLCLGAARFQVAAEWTTATGTSGQGQAVALTDDTGYYWFFDDANVEVVTKIVDGCALNGRFWFFAAGLTDVKVQLTVTDTVTGAVASYANPQGTAFAPVQDTAAFACAEHEPGRLRDAAPLPPQRSPGFPQSLRSLQSLKSVAAVAAAQQPALPPALPRAAPPAPTVCDPSDVTALCLSANRFQVRARWQANGSQGTAQAVPITADTGYFWFFDAANVELVVKVLDGCALNQDYWVFAAGLTNVDVTIEVTDVVTGLARSYHTAAGAAFAPLQDTTALAACLASCDSKQLTPQQVNQAVAAGSQGLADPFGADFNLVMNRFMALEGCGFQRAGGAPQVGGRAASASRTEYCGPGNSGDGTHGYLNQLDPSDELNQACAQHDACYTSHCVANGCYFDPSTRATPCDGPLFNLCQQIEAADTDGNCGNTDDCFICGVASFLNDRAAPTSGPCSAAPCTVPDGKTCDSSTGMCAGLPDRIDEKEGPYSGTWQLSGSQYYAQWDNGAIAILTVTSLGGGQLVIDRVDISDSVSAGLSAIYMGQIASGGTAIANGVVTWTWPGVSGYPHTGTWSATWNGSLPTASPLCLPGPGGAATLARER